jgi:hypothetical protein
MHLILVLIWFYNIDFTKIMLFNIISKIIILKFKDSSIHLWYIHKYKNVNFSFQIALSSKSH